MGAGGGPWVTVEERKACGLCCRNGVYREERNGIEGCFGAGSRKAPVAPGSAQSLI